jgi:hypothetical protein
LAGEAAKEERTDVHTGNLKQFQYHGLRAGFQAKSRLKMVFRAKVIPDYRIFLPLPDTCLFVPQIAEVSRVVSGWNAS